MKSESTLLPVSVGVFRVNPDSRVVIYDPGLRNVAPFRSSISNIDGVSGTLLYRETSIYDAWKWDSFELMQKLFNRESTVDLKSIIPSTFMIDDLYHMRQRFPELDPVDVFSFLLRSRFCRFDEINEEHTLLTASLMLLILNSMTDNQDDIANLADDYLSFFMGTGVGYDDLLRRMAINLHAEHGMNCSTNVVRCVASAGGSLVSCIVAGIEAFRAPLHGGASQNVSDMIDDIIESGYSTKYYLDNLISKKKRIPGIGHRIYNTWDPRAKIMYDFIDEHFSLFDERRCNVVRDIVGYVESDRFTTKGIFPNPDMFNGLIFEQAFGVTKRNIGFLILSRMIGWTAHFIEEKKSMGPIIRPTHVE